MSRFIIALFVLIPVTLLSAEPAAPVDEKAQAAEHIKALSSEDFDARQNALNALKKMSAEVLPLLRETVAATQDAEVRNLGRRAIKAIAMNGGTDPAELAGFGREDALAKRYTDAAKFYGRAARFFKEQAEKAAEESAKTELNAKGAKAAEREKRALALAGSGTDGEGGGNAGGMQVRVQGGAGAGMAVVVRANGVVVGGGGAAGAESGDDW